MHRYESPEGFPCPIRGSESRDEEPEERNEEKNSPLLSQFLGQGLIDFLISRPST